MTQTPITNVKNRNAPAKSRNAIVSEMQRIVRLMGGEGERGESVQAAIRRVSRRLGLSYRRTYSFWYGLDCAVLAVEADQLRAVELRLLAEQRARLTVKLNQVSARLNALEEPGNVAITSTEVGPGLGLAR